MEQLVRNSVWQVTSEFVDLKSELYRVLDIFAKSDLLILIELQTGQKLKRPFCFSLEIFELGIQNKKVVMDTFVVHPTLSLSEEEITPDWKNKRDKNYGYISGLVEDSDFLLKFSRNKKLKEITELADNLKKHPTTIYRLLYDFYRYGQTSNAFIPQYPNSGAPGKSKKDTDKTIGRTKQQPEYDFQERKTISVTEKERKNIRTTVKKYLINGDIDKVSKAYDNYLNDYHKKEIESAKKEGRAPNVINLEQFRYHFKKSRDIVEDGKKKHGDRAWEMKYKGLLGSVRNQVIAPGDRFEIDATIADVYVVCKYNRRKVLGRPVIYVVVDTASRNVVGIYVGIKYASWDAVKQALLNAFSPKPEFCARYGIYITDEDWPCHHLPRALMCDNGEMIGLKPELSVAPMGIALEFAASGRADWKSVVERRFGIANEEVFHQMAGTTKGKPKQRMEPDPKTKAIYTLNEVITTLIEDFIDFNKTRYIEDLVIPGLIESNDEPAPLNYWNFFVSEHLDSLTSVDMQRAIVELAPVARASVTARGIKIGKRYYTCQKAEEENWFSKARVLGQWSMDARTDDMYSNIVYVRENIRSPLLPCSLLPREKLYADLHNADVVWIDEWKREKNETGSSQYGKVRQADRMKNLKGYAQEDRKRTCGSYNDSPNITQNGKRSKRKNEEDKQSNLNVINNRNSERSENERNASLVKLKLIEQVLEDE